MNMAAKKKKKAARKGPSCKVLKNPDGSTKKTAKGRVRKICHGKDGKITSEANVKAYRARQSKK